MTRVDERRDREARAMSGIWRRMGWPLLVAAVVAVGIAGLAVSAALDHNPQEAYCAYDAAKDSCAIQLGAVAVIALSWFLPAFAVAAGASVAVTALVRFVAR